MKKPMIPLLMMILVCSTSNRTANALWPVQPDIKIKKMLEDRAASARIIYNIYYQRCIAGGNNEDQMLHVWSRRWLSADLELCEKNFDRDLAAYRSRRQEITDLIEGGQNRGAPAKNPAEKENDVPLPKLKTEQEYFDAIWKAYQDSKTDEERVWQASVEWLQAQQSPTKGKPTIPPYHYRLI